MSAGLIGLDWGTSSLRAYLIGEAGAVLDRREATAGILNVEHSAFETAFREAVGDWRQAHPNCTIVASGMITSRQGWIETPYLFCPAGRTELAANLHRQQLDDGAVIHFITGLVQDDGAAGIPDVMRGEETQIVGSFGPDENGIAVMPGSHSKWVRIEHGRITGFTTFMTGEIYAALIKQTILGRTVTNAREDEGAFRQGLALGLDTGPARGGILGRLFSARTLVLFERLDGDSVPSYVSGLVLGTEIREAERAFEAKGETVTVIGGESLMARYRTALAEAGIEARSSPADRAASGHHIIAQQAGLI